MIKKIVIVIIVFAFYVASICSAVVCWQEPESDECNDVRLVRVEWWGTTQDGATVLRDEQGHEWMMDAMTINGDDVMLEIHNNNTPNRYWDDVVLKVWQGVEPEV